MAKTFSSASIERGDPILASDVSQSVEAFTAASEYRIWMSGSFSVTGSITGSDGVIQPQIQFGIMVPLLQQLLLIF